MQKLELTGLKCKICSAWHLCHCLKWTALIKIFYLTLSLDYCMTGECWTHCKFSISVENVIFSKSLRHLKPLTAAAKKLKGRSSDYVVYCPLTCCQANGDKYFESHHSHAAFIQLSRSCGIFVALELIPLRQRSLQSKGRRKARSFGSVRDSIIPAFGLRVAEKLML